MTLVLSTKHGAVTVPDAVLIGIAVRAAESVDGVRVRRRRAVDADSRVVRLGVSIRRGEPLVELASRAQEAVASAMSVMCGIDAKVEIAIGELA
jgi:uncharacterized alkaline shock family protein YloU